MVVIFLLIVTTRQYVSYTGPISFNLIMLVRYPIGTHVSNDHPLKDISNDVYHPGIIGNKPSISQLSDGDTNVPQIILVHFCLLEHVVVRLL